VIVASLLFVEALLHLLTLVGVLPVNRYITPWFYQKSNATYSFDKYGAPISVGGFKTYWQYGIPPRPQFFDEKGYRPIDSKRFLMESEKIGFFGDSFTEGLQVDDSETFPRITETKLRLRRKDTHCFNFGIGGTATYHQYLRFLTISEDIKLDHAILCFLPINDVLGNHERLGKPFEFYKAPYLTLRQGKFEEIRQADSGTVRKKLSFKRKTIGSFFISRVFSYGPHVTLSVFLNYLSRSKEDEKEKTNNYSIERAEELNKSGIWVGSRSSWLNVFNPPNSEDWEEAWTITEEVLRRFATATKNKSIRFSVVLVAGNLQIDFDDVEKRPNWVKGCDFSYPNRRLKEFCDQNGIECFNSLPFFLETKERLNLEPPNFCWKTDGHYNQVGHLTMAEFLCGSVFKDNQGKE